jgi:hypothetical protein
VVSLAFWSSWPRLRSEGNEFAMLSADRVLQDRYVARLLDFAHLALMLRGIEPSLERDWIEESLAVHARELEQDFRQSRIAGHAMKMITGYYTKNNLPVPPELAQIWKSLHEDPKLAMTHSDWAIVKAFNERLAAFDAYMDARRTRDELPNPENSSAGQTSAERPNQWSGARKIWNAVSF